jgi:hypothetical protein
MVENQQKFTEKNILLNDLDEIKLKINENKTSLEQVEGELAKRKTELQSIMPPKQEQNEPLIDDLLNNEEIDRSVEVLDDNLKTKKIDFQAELDED